MNTKSEFVDGQKMIVPSPTLVIRTDAKDVEKKFEDSFNTSGEDCVTLNNVGQNNNIPQYHTDDD
jgi:hypothetical protein